MGEEEALLPLDPDEVQVPVVVGRRELAEGDGAAAEEIEHLLGAPHDHPANLPAIGRASYAAAWYSWISPPSRSRRVARTGNSTSSTGVERSGGASPSARCGRCAL